MSRTVEAIHNEILSLLPLGWVWPRGKETLLATILKPIAQGMADLERLAEQCFQETDPRTAKECITDFERVLGPDPCQPNTESLPLSKRQQIAHMRWTARGGASVEYFRRIAELYGVTITVKEFTTSQAGWLRAGDELINSPCQYLWEVTIPALIEGIPFRAGESVAGDRLWSFVISDLECVLRRLKPAHTHITFIYKDI